MLHEIPSILNFPVSGFFAFKIRGEIRYSVGIFDYASIPCRGENG